MAGQKFINLVALLSLAVIGCSFGALPAEAAIAAHGAGNHLNRAEHHNLAAKKQRRQNAAGTKRCRKRPTVSSLAHPTSSAVFSSSVAASTKVAASSEAPVTSTTKEAPPPPKTPSPSPEPTKSSAAPPPPPPTPTPKPSTTKTSTTEVATTTKVNTNTGGNIPGGPKVGLAWPNGPDPALKNFKTGSVQWVYSWSPFPPANYKELGLKFIPMLWGPKQEADFVKLARQNANGGWVASFNEPNQNGQSDLDPYYAAEVHMRVIEPLRRDGFKVIAPATSSDPNGMVWMKKFMGACKNCEFHGMGIHYYDINVDGFIKYMNLWHDTFGLPLWVTEFACQNFNGGAQRNKDEVWNFWAESVKYMNAQPWVVAHFGFGAMRDMQGVNPDNQLMKGSGQPTDLGYTYINNNFQ